jgi:hypothetical protein
MIQKLMATVTLVVVLYVVWQGIQNSSSSATEAMGQGLAKDHACDVDPSCVLRSGPSIARADALRRRYQFRTAQGLVTVTCSRQ